MAVTGLSGCSKLEDNSGSAILIPVFYLIFLTYFYLYIYIYKFFFFKVLVNLLILGGAL